MTTATLADLARRLDTLTEVVTSILDDRPRDRDAASIASMIARASQEMRDMLTQMHAAQRREIGTLRQYIDTYIEGRRTIDDQTVRTDMMIIGAIEEIAARLVAIEGRVDP